ncbi:PAS domain-containing protein [Rhodovibrio sodomensis]|uniref:PAS domain-containing protein n=1 Tax=Rhodovibrio sodomensis TaxID=1088 RepID=UPI001906D70A|nr:PAS domain-containing protein [Rhodovibrio sodomensis]
MDFERPLPRGSRAQQRQSPSLDQAAVDKTFGKLRADALRELADYWLARRGDAAMPRRADIDPMALGSHHLPRLILADVLREPLRFHFQLVGEQLEHQLGGRFTGKTIDISAGAFFKPYQAVATQTRPIREFIRYDFNDGDPAGAFERLLLPLSEDGEMVTMVFGEAIYTRLITREGL